MKREDSETELEQELELRLLSYKGLQVVQEVRCCIRAKLHYSVVGLKPAAKWRGRGDRMKGGLGIFGGKAWRSRHPLQTALLPLCPSLLLSFFSRGNRSTLLTLAGRMILILPPQCWVMGDEQKTPSQH